MHSLHSSSSAFVLFVTAAAALFGLCGAQTCNPESLTVEPMKTPHIHRLIDKKWYVQQIFYRRAEDVAAPPSFNCSMHYVVGFFGEPYYLTEQYTPISSGVATHNGSHIDHPALAGNEAVWSVYLNDYREKYRTILTHTDYESYGIMHWCPFLEFEVAHSMERIMTFTGVPDPEQALLDELAEKVVSLGFPTQYGVPILHGPDCDYEPCEKEGEACCDPIAVSVPPMVGFDIWEIGNNFWYVHEIFLREGEELSGPPPSCYRQAFGVRPSYGWLDIVHTTTDANGNITTSYHVGIPSEIANKQAVLEMYSGWVDREKAVITHTDYESHLVIHYCPFHENLERKVEQMMVLTTSSTPPGGLELQNLRKMVASVGFPIDNGVRIHHDAECEYYDYGNVGQVDRRDHDFEE